LFDVSLNNHGIAYEKGNLGPAVTKQQAILPGLRNAAAFRHAGEKKDFTLETLTDLGGCLRFF